MTEWLQCVGRDFLDVTTETDVYQTTVDITRRVLDADSCKLAIARDDMLVPEVSSPPFQDNPEAGLPIASSIPGTVYTSGEPCVIEDLLDVRSSATAHHSNPSSEVSEVRAMITVPFDDFGVLVAASREPGAFTQTDLEHVVQISAFAAVVRQFVSSRPVSASQVNRLEEVASILSHDLRTPLNVVHGRLELAKATGDEKHFEHAFNAIDRIEEITDDLVMLARTDDRIGTLESVDLDDVVNTAWMTVGTPSATLVLDESTTILADRSTLCQFMENLFQNAIDHGGDTVTVWVGTTDEGFYVEDDGPGIPADKRDQIFEWRHSSEADQTGLGLSIVNEIAEAHGWTITVSESDAGGARFEIVGVDKPSTED